MLSATERKVAHDVIQMKDAVGRRRGQRVRKAYLSHGKLHYSKKKMHIFRINTHREASYPWKIMCCCKTIYAFKRVSQVAQLFGTRIYTSKHQCFG